MSRRHWRRGDWAIFQVQKMSDSPGPRAREVIPAAKGEMYHYVVSKFWIVQRVLGDGRLELRTRRGKAHVVSVDDPRLRRPFWWELLLLRRRFRRIVVPPEGAGGA